VSLCVRPRLPSVLIVFCCDSPRSTSLWQSISEHHLETEEAALQLIAKGTKERKFAGLFALAQ
jgi:hypothetical protein